MAHGELSKKQPSSQKTSRDFEKRNAILEKITTPPRFEEELWMDLANSVAQAFRFTKDEHARFLANRLAKLIAAIPFLASCSDPERTAVSHLGTYVLSVRSKRFALARPTDDTYLLRRIELLSNYIGGDRKIIKRGMGLIALVMLEDYHRDREADSDVGKYNPINSGAFHYEVCRRKLMKKIEKNECPQMDEILKVSNTRMIFWEL